MLGDRRSRLAALLWAASAVAIVTTACGSAVEEPPPGARVVSSGAAEPVTPDMATAAALTITEAVRSTREPSGSIAVDCSPTSVVNAVGVAIGWIIAKNTIAAAAAAAAIPLHTRHPRRRTGG